MSYGAYATVMKPKINTQRLENLPRVQNFADKGDNKILEAD